MSQMIEQLRADFKAAHQKLQEAEAAEREKNASKLIGKFFKYHNGYSNEDRWWLYFRVDEFVGTSVRGLAFERENQGEIMIHPLQTVSVYSEGSLSSDYREISGDEFAREWGKLFNALGLIDAGVEHRGVK